jgi:hypothetical protein
MSGATSVKRDLPSCRRREFFTRGTILVYSRPRWSKNLADCKLFVQLLFRRFQGQNRKRCLKDIRVCQHELAVRAGVKYFNGRSADLRVNEVEGCRAHRELLDGDHVIACGIAEFKQHVVAEANRKPAATTARQAAGRSGIRQP